MKVRKRKRFKRKFVRLGGSQDPIGYCHLHKRTLSKQQMKSKQCVAKECGALQKYLEHPYWVKSNKAKQSKEDAQ